MGSLLVRGGFAVGSRQVRNGFVALFGFAVSLRRVCAGFVVGSRLVRGGLICGNCGGAWAL